MIRKLLVLVLIALCAPSVIAAPPKVPGPKLVAVGEVFEVEFTLDPKGPAILSNPYPLEDVFIREAVPVKAGTVAYIVQAKKPGTYRLTLWTKGDVVTDTLPVSYYDFTVSGTAPVTPTPVPPTPVPPAPVVVSSFRAFLVYDAAVTLLAGDYGLLYGLETEKALTAACNIPNASGWRRFNHKTDPATLPAGFKEAWAAAKPKVTTTPCVVFQVNDKITLEPFPATQADMNALIAKYREGR